MYEILKIGQKEKTAFANMLYPVDVDLEHAWYMLEELQELFGPKPHALREDEAERLWHTVSIVENVIYNTLTYIYLTTGDMSWPGAQAFLRSADVVKETQT